MDHLAIMKKSWDLTSKILTGEKKIETRWYMHKRVPWDKVNFGDVIYFKDSGCPVTAKAEVEKVVQIEDLYEEKIDRIINDIWQDDVVDKSKIKHLKGYAKDKKYCILIYLKNPEPVIPFNIDKKAYGAQVAWICLQDINKIRLPL